MSTLPAVQTEVRLMRVPEGMPVPGKDLVVNQRAPVPDARSLKEGEVLVHNLWLSLDPAMRGWMNPVRSYVEPVRVGDVMRGMTVAEVIASRSSRFSPGELVTGTFGWREFAVAPEAEVEHSPVPAGSCPSLALGVLGHTGLTAYFGLLRVGNPKPGDTVLVSAAAGATGSVVAQIAKHVLGCRTIGLAGGPAKCAWLVEELGLDGAIDYKATAPENLAKEIRRLCPKGVDVFFDNVGGVTLNETLKCLRRGARVVICGGISAYNASGAVEGPSNYLQLLVARARMEGFVVFDYMKEYPTALRDLGQWLAQGKVKSKTHVAEGGLAAAPEALLWLFRGQNEGKLVVRVAEPIVAGKPKAKL